MKARDIKIQNEFVDFLIQYWSLHTHDARFYLTYYPLVEAILKQIAIDKIMAIASAQNLKDLIAVIKTQIELLKINIDNEEFARANVDRYTFKMTFKNEIFKKQSKTIQAVIGLLITLIKNGTTCGDDNNKIWIRPDDQDRHNQIINQTFSGAVGRNFSKQWFWFKKHELDFRIAIAENQRYQDNPYWTSSSAIHPVYHHFIELCLTLASKLKFIKLYQYLKIRHAEFFKINDPEDRDFVRLLNQDYLLLYLITKFQFNSGSTLFNQHYIKPLLAKALKDLKKDIDSLFIDNMMSDSLKRLTKTNILIAPKNLQAYGLKTIIDKELTIFNFIKSLKQQPLDTHNNVIDNQLSGFDADQVRAIKYSLKHHFTIINGGPGCGKTTVVKQLVEIFKQNQQELLLLSPTGKAAQVLQSKANHQAMTISALITIINANITDRGQLLVSNSDDKTILGRIKNQLITLVIDEFSMVDIQLFYKLIWVLKRAEININRLIIIGDQRQLPAIGFGNLLDDYLKVFAKHVQYLSHNHRQNDLEGQAIRALLDCFKTYGAIENELKPVLAPLEQVNELIKNFDFKKSQILVFHNDGHLGKNDLNRKVQQKYFAHDPDYKFDAKYRQYFVGDRVVQLQNDYNLNVYNGQIGTVTNIVRKANGQIDQATIAFDNLVKKQEVVYSGKQLVHATDLAYALTVHKAQGSEYENVDLVIDKQCPPALLSNASLYTAISRAQNRLTIYAHPNTIKWGYWQRGRRMTYSQSLKNNDEVGLNKSSIKTIIKS